MRIARQIHEQMTQQAVDQPGLRRLALRHLVEGDLEFIELLIAAFIDSGRLTRGTDEETGEQIGEGRMVLPVGDQAAQQVRAAQNRAVRRRRTANGDVIAPPVPVWRPSIMNFSVPRRASRASS